MVRDDQWSGAYPDATVSAGSGICYTVKWVYGNAAAVTAAIAGGFYQSITCAEAIQA